MRLKFFDRFLIVLSAVVLTAMAALAFLMAWNVLPYSTISDYLDRIYHVDINMWITTGVGALLLILVVGLLFIGLSRAKMRQSTYVFVQGTEGGALKIASKTLKEIICKEINKIEGVTGSQIKILSKDQQVALITKVSVTDNMVLPEIASQIQSNIKASIISMTGLDIAKIDVLIDNQ